MQIKCYTKIQICEYRVIQKFQINRVLYSTRLLMLDNILFGFFVRTFHLTKRPCNEYSQIAPTTILTALSNNKNNNNSKNKNYNHTTCSRVDTNVSMQLYLYLS